MVRLGARSGYAIKKATDVSTRFFWPMSLAQVYPELARLEQAGLLSRADDPSGNRGRFAYELTDAGEEALLEWLHSPGGTETQFRDEGILRLFFADILPLEQQIALVALIRRRTSEGAAHAREQIVPLAEALEEGGTYFPAHVARMRADSFAHIEQLLGRLQAELEAQRHPAE